MARIIMIHGLIESGKDLVGQLIAKHLRDIDDSRCYRVAFGDAVKANIEIITGIERKQVPREDWSGYIFPFKDFTREQKREIIPHFNITIGEMCQQYATEAVRNNFNENTWVYAFLTQLPHPKDELYQKTVVIVPDLRFINESKVSHDLKKAGYKVDLIKVIRPKHNVKGDKRSESHQSEEGLSSDLFDHVIINDGTVQDLKNKISKLSL